MSFEIECVVESLATEGTEVAFDVTVTLDVTVEEALEREHLVTHTTDELVISSLYSCKRERNDVTIESLIYPTI